MFAPSTANNTPVRPPPQQPDTMVPPAAAETPFLLVLNGHNGDTVKLSKPIRYHTLNDFKQFLVQSFTRYVLESPDNVFLLTSFGIKLNFSIINELTEVYVFDRRLFSESSDQLVRQYLDLNTAGYAALARPTPQPFGFASAANIKQATTELKQFQAAAKSLQGHLSKANELVAAYLKQINVVFKGLNVIFQFINSFINDIEKDFHSYFNYVKLLNYKSLHKNWAQHYKSLEKFPPVRFDNSVVLLPKVLDSAKLAREAKYVETQLPAVLRRFDDIVAEINTINSDKLKVDKLIELERNESINKFSKKPPDSEELARLVSSISADIDSLNSTTNSELISQIYKKSKSNHDLLTNYHDTITAFLTTTYKFRLSMASTNLKIFSSIAQLQMRIVSVKDDLRALSSPDSANAGDSVSCDTIAKIKKAEDYLSLTIDLPLLFGLLMIEKRRQFEWYDFYSKGIVGNITEQLVTIIDHEKLFQKLWLKKFGNFSLLINHHDAAAILKPYIPNLDVTLIHSHDTQIIFDVLKNAEVGRNDILEYIKLIEKFEDQYLENSHKFSTLLNKNFKDLTKCTSNLKSVTKLISSLSSFTSPNNDMSASKINNIEDFDNNLVKGLKSRIKKLENLLHQQQFKNLSSWPVTRDHSNGSNIITFPKNTTPPLPSHAYAKNNTKAKSMPSVPRINSTSDPKALLTKRAPGSPTTTSVLDASTTIDKHLDNIRLRKENKELLEDNDFLAQQHYKDSERIASLERELELLKAKQINDSKDQEQTWSARKKEADARVLEVKEDYERRLREREDFFQEKLDVKQKEIEISKNSSLQELRIMKDQEINQLNEKLVRKDQDVASLEKKVYELTNNVKELEARSSDLANKVTDLNLIKAELISNMSSKETEFIADRNNFENEIKELNEKLESVTEDYDHLMEMTADNEKNKLMIKDLNDVIQGLFHNIQVLINLHYDSCVEFCLILESMGLLLIKEVNDHTNTEEFKVTRVKGLRSKKGEDPDISIISIHDKPSTKVLNDISVDWVNNLKVSNDEDLEVRSLATVNSNKELEEIEEEISRSNNLIALYHDNFKSSNRVEKFIDKVTFTTEPHERFFLNAISKRFRDVEGFAKKLTKENKVKNQELVKFANRLRNKISMNNFQQGDLVLFLPTRIEKTSDVKLESQPWAAFNIGAPHYFLHTSHLAHLDGKEWLVARIAEITEHRVTEATVGDPKANPYQLSLGVTWYAIEAKEEII